MKIVPDYTKLNIELAKKRMNKNFLRTVVDLAPTTVAKFNKRQMVSLEILARIAYHLECGLDDLVEFEYIDINE